MKLVKSRGSRIGSGRHSGRGEAGRVRSPSVSLVIHWTTCVVYTVATANYNYLLDNINGLSADIETYYLNKGGERRPSFDFNYWMPPVHLNDAETDFYDLTPFNQYVRLFYYVMLLLMGNDIGP